MISKAYPHLEAILALSGYLISVSAGILHGQCWDAYLPVIGRSHRHHSHRRISSPTAVQLWIQHSLQPSRLDLGGCCESSLTNDICSATEFCPSTVSFGGRMLGNSSCNRTRKARGVCGEAVERGYRIVGRSLKIWRWKEAGRPMFHEDVGVDGDPCQCVCISVRMRERLAFAVASTVRLFDTTVVNPKSIAREREVLRDRDNEAKTRRILEISTHMRRTLWQWT